MERRRITVAILALGGEGGGVLADWLVGVGEQNGYFVQATSIPGVAQRTGSTVYYLELFPEAELDGRQPALALMPVPGDVDIVIASELMEAGRAILRGLVTPERTALITSTHRIYAISEKSAISGGLADSSKVLEATAGHAKSRVAFDMEAVSARTGSAISAVMLGAAAASGVLPFTRAQFETAIRASGIAVDANLSGFAAGLEAGSRGVEAEMPAVETLPQPTTENGRRIFNRVHAELPVAAHLFTLEGARRLMDYQDMDYAALYLDRLGAIKTLDSTAWNWVLTREVARALALWMSYEDVMRVAQQKVGRARMDKVRAEVNVRPDQLLHVTEYMHPRWQEFCDTLPAGLGRRLQRSAALKRLSPWFEKGRHVRTTNIFWFLMLSLLAARRGARRGTLRFGIENARIENWLASIGDAAQSNYAAAVELARNQNLIKGYGETHERGLRKFDTVMSAWRNLRGSVDAANRLRRLREAALEDEDGAALQTALQKALA
jgi:indolepyruvate ferredoxin oxidoreductase beta subunit